MFYVGYLPAELMRRKGRTILTMLGLALGVGLVVANASLSEAKEIAGLDGAAAVSSGLSLQAVHQEGKVPAIVARIQRAGTGSTSGEGSRL